MSGEPPRLKSAIWVSAFIRRSEINGKFGAVLNKGAAEAGSIFVVINHLDGTYDLLGPPPGPSINDEGERRFAKEIAQPADWPTIHAKLEQKKKFDRDIWIVEIEDRTGLAGLEPE